MRNRILSAIMALVVSISVFYGVSSATFAAGTDFGALDDMGNQLDELTKQLNNLDLNNLPTGDDSGNAGSITGGTSNSTNKTEIKTKMMIAASNTYTLGLKSNGQVIACGTNLSGATDVSDWSSITMIAAGFDHSVGLKSDGTVVASGTNAEGQCDVSGWKDIVAVAAGRSSTIGLKKDGTVVGAGADDHGELDVSGWKNIVAIAAGANHSVGLRNDGTVVAVGKNCGGILDTSEWRDIVSISASSNDIMGLDKNGKVYSTFANNVSGFSDVVAIATAELYAAGLKKDGTVTVNSDAVDVSTWNGIVAIAAGTSHIVGLKSDGTVVAADLKDGEAWDMGQTKVGSWQLDAYKNRKYTATPSMSKVLVNGTEKSFDAYTIEGSNYFKLRDLAFVLNGTEKQFEVAWDSGKNAINMLSDKPYVKAGGEMTKGSGKSGSATASTAKIYIDGKEAALTAYTMNGNNYFKLRDVMKLFDVYVGWDAGKNTITLDTGKSY